MATHRPGGRHFVKRDFQKLFSVDSALTNQGAALQASIVRHYFVFGGLTTSEHNDSAQKSCPIDLRGISQLILEHVSITEVVATSSDKFGPHKRCSRIGSSVALEATATAKGRGY